MDACYSPSYAGLYLGKWEEDYVFNGERNGSLSGGDDTLTMLVLVRIRSRVTNFPQLFE